MKNLYLYICLAFGMLKTISLNAQNNLEDLSLEDLMNFNITTVSKVSEKVIDAPASVMVIRRKDIIDRGYSNLKDIFQDLPGMEAFENAWSERGTIVPVRGIIGNQKIIILLNGTRVNPAGGESFPFKSDFSIRGAKQIEVVYGPGSTLYGQDAISAVINVITEEADDKSLLEAQIIGGSNEHKEAYIQYSAPIKKNDENLGSITAMVQYTDTNLDDLSKTWAEWYDRIDNIGGNAQMVRFDKGLNAFLNIKTKNTSIQVWHRESSRNSSEGGNGGLLYFQPEAIWHDRTTVVEARNNLDVSDRISLESSLTYNRYEVDSESRYVFPSGPDSFFLDDYKYAQGNRVSFEEKLSWSISDKLSAVAGLLFVTNDIIPKSTVPSGADTSSDLASQGGNWDYIDSSGDSISIPRVHNILFQQYGAYGEVQMNPIDKLKLSLGIRADASTLYSDVPVSPRLAAVYTINENLTAKYIYTQAYVIPSPNFGYSTFFDGVGLNIINDDLQPETARSNEINISYNKTKISAYISGYYNTQENLILPAEFRSEANILDEFITYNGSTVLLTQSANQGSSRTMGIDLYGRFRLNKVSIWGSYSFVDAETTIDGQKRGLDMISAHNMRLGVTMKFIPKMTNTLSGKISSTPEGILEQSSLFGLDDEVKTPYQINLHTNYQINDHFRAFVNVKNLTNHKYAVRGLINPTVMEQIKLTVGVSFTL